MSYGQEGQHLHIPLGWEQLARRPGAGTPSRMSLAALSDLLYMTWPCSHRHEIKHHTRKREKGKTLEIQEKEKAKKKRMKLDCVQKMDLHKNPS